MSQKFNNLFKSTILLFSLISAFSAESQNKEKTKETPKAAAPVQEPEAVNFSAKDVWNTQIFDREDHKVLVIQERKFSKTNRLQLGLNADFFQNTPFVDSFGVGANVGFFFSEYYGVEIFGNFYSNSDSKEGSRISDFIDVNLGTGVNLETPEPTLFAGASFVWNPIYGKFAFFDRNIIHFDIYASLGISYLATESNAEAKGTNPATVGKDQNIPGLVTGIGMRFYLNKYLTLRFDVRNNIFNYKFAATSGNPASANGKRTDSWLNRWQFGLGLSTLINLGDY